MMRSTSDFLKPVSMFSATVWKRLTIAFWNMFYFSSLSYGSDISEDSNIPYSPGTLYLVFLRSGLLSYSMGSCIYVGALSIYILSNIVLKSILAILL